MFTRVDMAEWKAAGLTEADIPSTEVWPENWEAYLLFSFMRSQWRAGPACLIGLDYNVLYTRLARMQLTEEDHELLLQDVRVMEFEAIDAMTPDTPPP
jgi:hypothetical protein